MAEEKNNIIIDAKPSAAVASVIESLNKAKKNRGRPKSTQPKRRGRPPKKQAADKKTSSKPAKAKIVDLPKSVEIKRPIIPQSLINLIFFAAIIASLVIAHLSLKSSREKTIPVVISSAAITAEEEVEGTEIKEAAKETEESKEVPEEIKVETTEQVVEENATEKTETEEVKVIGDTEETKEATDEAKKEEKAAPVKKRESPYAHDPYTNGGPLDLDGPAYRHRYVAKTIKTIKTAPQQYQKNTTIEEMDIQGLNLTDTRSHPITTKSLQDYPYNDINTPDNLVKRNTEY